MARFRRLQAAQQLIDSGLVPVFYHADTEVAIEVLKAVYEAGVRVFEFTNRGDKAHEVFSDLMGYTRSKMPDMVLGVGSVIDAPTAALYLQLGANFVVSPLLNEETAYLCNQRKVLWSPGCGSVTEIDKAHRLGAEIVKIFPGTQVGGPGFVKAILGPMPWTLIMPTGGVSPEGENLQSWFDAGACCVGMGSKLIDKQAVSTGNYQKISTDVKNAYHLIKEIRNL